MKIEIETRFNVDEKVWIIYNNKAVQCNIEEFKVNYTQDFMHFSNVEIKYVLKTTGKHSEEIKEVILEKRIFNSKEALLASL